MPASSVLGFAALVRYVGIAASVSMHQQFPPTLDAAGASAEADKVDRQAKLEAATMLLQMHSSLAKEALTPGGPGATAPEKPEEPGVGRHPFSVAPDVWAVLGPLTPFEAGTDPLLAFGGIKEAAKRVVPSVWKVVRDRGRSYRELARGVKNHSEIISSLRAANLTQLPLGLREGSGGFPSDDGPNGTAFWELAFSDWKRNQTSVASNGTARLKSLRRGSGWAVGDIELAEQHVVLARCTKPFMLDGDYVTRVPDVYGDYRAVHALSLPAGRHRIFVHYEALPFWCDLLRDSADARQQVTEVTDAGAGLGSLVALKDSMMSDVVDGYLASPYLAVPVLNVAIETLVVLRAQVVKGPRNLSVRAIPERHAVPIQPGKTHILRLELKQDGALKCAPVNLTDLDAGYEMKLTVRLHPARHGAGSRGSSDVEVVAPCHLSEGGGAPARAGGFLVTFPDFDGSVQQMWVAPPNVSTLLHGRCPEEGCPVMLSLHGADVAVGPVWGHTYAAPGRWEFPYPAWLVQPSNRYDWGTDWEGPGFDNILAAIIYVREWQPGVPGAERHGMKVDTGRMLVTGHSMGGHGCYVYSVHDPDRVVAAACNSGWSERSRALSVSIDPAGLGLLQAPVAEHAADYLVANMAGVPLNIIYGDSDDNVDPMESRYMARLVDSISGDTSAVTLVELPNTGHWYDQNVPELVSFLWKPLGLLSTASHPELLPPFPESFDFEVPNPLTFGTKGNLKVLQLLDPVRPGKLSVRRCMAGARGNCRALVRHAASTTPGLQGGPTRGDPLWLIETQNVRRFRLMRPSTPRRPLPDVVRLDGTLFSGSSLIGSEGQHFCLLRPGGQDAVPIWGVCGAGRGELGDAGRLWESVQRGGPQAGGGPLHMVLRRAPLCIAHGGAAAHRQEAMYLAHKLYFVSRYAVPIVDTTTLEAANSTPAFCRGANLILLGHPGQNAWTARHRCAFPYVGFHQWPSRGFTLGGRAYTGPRTGLLALGRLPEGRLALLVHGTDAEGLSRAGLRVPVSSGQGGADFLVLGPDEGWKGEGGVLAAGFLDALWQPTSASWAWPAPATVAAAAMAPWDFAGLGGGGAGSACRRERAELERSDAELQALAGKHAARGRAPAAQGGSRWWAALLGICTALAL